MKSNDAPEASQLGSMLVPGRAVTFRGELPSAFVTQICGVDDDPANMTSCAPDGDHIACPCSCQPLAPLAMIWCTPLPSAAISHRLVLVKSRSWVPAGVR